VLKYHKIWKLGSDSELKILYKTVYNVYPLFTILQILMQKQTLLGRGYCYITQVTRVLTTII